MCAGFVRLEESYVIPGHSIVEREDFHFITADMVTPPEWCERPLEQTITSPDEKVEIRPDESVVFDGNDLADRRRKLTLSGDRFPDGLRTMRI